ncbi:Serine/threonine-protein kinase/endoribonuclease IRE1 [Smittium mucronatum]|uniref:non-specific serine/threonine protein kinase n=1 Tax=Smittium mucronatum TaxID=133383 RepID=A0A1R0H1S5_9FUNG|nr:Serine/threonine-protein kinase/endoribonuclease IRE1 [Smittium mucronatum]
MIQIHLSINMTSNGYTFFDVNQKKLTLPTYNAEYLTGENYRASNAIKIYHLNNQDLNICKLKFPGDFLDISDSRLCLKSQYLSQKDSRDLENGVDRHNSHFLCIPKTKVKTPGKLRLFEDLFAIKSCLNFSDHYNFLLNIPNFLKLNSTLMGFSYHHSLFRTYDKYTSWKPPIQFCPKKSLCSNSALMFTSKFLYNLIYNMFLMLFLVIVVIFGIASPLNTSLLNTKRYQNQKSSPGDFPIEFTLASDLVFSIFEISCKYDELTFDTYVSETLECSNISSHNTEVDFVSKNENSSDLSQTLIRPENNSKTRKLDSILKEGDFSRISNEIYRSYKNLDHKHNKASLGSRSIISNTSSYLNLSDRIIGYGSHGTVVYLGSFEGRPVAVKRLLLDFYNSATIEVRILQEADTHPNVIRYFCSEMSENFLFIALELCSGSMYDAINFHNLDPFSKNLVTNNSRSSFELMNKINPKRVLYQLALGLHHLHQMKLVHRDIKPQNILLALPINYIKNIKSRAEFSKSIISGKPPNPTEESLNPKISTDFFDPFDDLNAESISGEPRVVISDFGLSRLLQGEESSFFNTIHSRPTGINNGNNVFNGAGGTIGWRAPECFEYNVPPKFKYPNSNPNAGSLFTDSSKTNNKDLNLGVDNIESDELSNSTHSNPHALDSSSYFKQKINEDSDCQSIPSVIFHENSDDNIFTNSDQSTPSNFPGNINSYDISSGPSLDNNHNKIFHSKMTRKMDIFSLGCVYYYFLTKGEHPFGDRYYREQNILENKFDLSLLDEMDTYNKIVENILVNQDYGEGRKSLSVESISEAKDLITRMIQRNPSHRPSTLNILVHPYFWSYSKRLLFIQNVSDKLESYARALKSFDKNTLMSNQESKSSSKSKKKSKSKSNKNSSHFHNSDSPDTVDAQHIKENPGLSANFQDISTSIFLLNKFEEKKEFVLNTKNKKPSEIPEHEKFRWDKVLDKNLLKDLGGFRKYDFYKLRDLLRVVRNKKSHYQDLDPVLQESLGELPEGYCKYFESRFPNLLLHCYYFVISNKEFRNDLSFKVYFEINPI